jgi:flagellar biosynthesis protein FlhF
MGEKTYQGRTMKEALAKVRKDLGGDAIILASREVRRRRIFGLAPRPLIEVRASATMPARPSVAASPFPIRSGTETSAPLPADSHALAGDQMSRVEAVPPTLGKAASISHTLAELPAELLPTYARLVDNAVPELLARRVLRSVADRLQRDSSDDSPAIEDVVLQTVEQCIAVAPPCRVVAGTRRVVALIGPTGVGKTTTVAKLAASFKLVQGLRTGLVTVDTYRIAAVEQLKTYADIIDVPLAVANDPGGIRRAIEELGALDIVFVDTAGRSPRDAVRIRELEAFMAQSRPDEVHLVLSAGAGERALKSAVERFARVRPDRLIVTKLDEAQTLGSVFGLLGQANLPVSYLTTGQAVPDDIEAADRRRLARLILGWEVIG